MARWPGDVGDRAVHQLADAAVGRVALRRRAQLDDVHRFARVHVHVEADAIRHHHGVRRDVAQPVRHQLFVQIGRLIHDRAPVGERAGLLDRGRLDVAVARR